MDPKVHTASMAAGARAGVIAAVVGVTMIWASAACAQTMAPAAVLAAPCAACHGTGGISPGAIPSIAGMAAQVMAARMREFRNAGAEVTIMSRIARGYTDAEFDALGQYFSTLKR